ncbi:MAG: hypothetical protein FJY55_08445 [Betaproteobacteria bacterium]|nr:hypothetical protein [Betaproteobacteria bacterium]
MSDVRVIDAILTPQQQEWLEALILDNNSNEWTFVPSANFGTSKDLEITKSRQTDSGRFLNLENVVDSAQLELNLYRHQQVLPAFHDLFLGLGMGQLLKAKINITFHDPRHTDDSYGYPHSDLEGLGFKKYTTAIYYLNDSDGDTFIFNERVGDVFESLTVHSRVTPRRGRVVLFDGHRYHAGNNPRTHKPRALINLNFHPAG